MLVLLFTGAWYLLLVTLTVAAALHGRADTVEDRTAAYEQDRWIERTQHQRRVREEELAELRRREPARARTFA